MAESRRYRLLVTGGSGYVGFNVALGLVRLGHDVTVYDRRAPSHRYHSGMVAAFRDELAEFLITSYGQLRYVRGDIFDVELLERACQGVDGVIHCAGPRTSATSTMTPHSWRLSVDGTCSVIGACTSAGVGALVHVTSCDVVFDGRTAIVAGDELQPYPTPAPCGVGAHTQLAVAERLALTADAKHGRLRTCSLRLGRVVGLNGDRHTVRSCRRGSIILHSADRYGSLVDFLDVENAVQACSKAVSALVEQPEQVAGRAYFITDNQPQNAIEYFQPLLRTLHQDTTVRKLPYWVMYVVVYVASLVVWMTGQWSSVPWGTVAEMRYDTVTRYFSIGRARRDLKYVPGELIHRGGVKALVENISDRFQ